MPSREVYRANRIAILEKRREEYWANRDFFRQKRKENYQRNKVKQRAQSNERVRVLRLSLLTHLGGKCVKCGFSDIRALQLDHIAGGGLKERDKFKGPVTMYYYYSKNLDIAKEKLQVLCANCNYVKRYENEEGHVSG